MKAIIEIELEIEGKWKPEYKERVENEIKGVLPYWINVVYEKVWVKFASVKCEIKGV